MQRIANYTISSLKSLSTLPKMDCAQVTLNSRVFPSKRKTVQVLQELSPFHNSKVIIHYDFIYLATRFCMFKKSVRDAVIKECVDIMNYASRDNSVVGIIMHTDFSLKKGVDGSSNEEKVKHEYTGSVWDWSEIYNSLSFHYNNWIEWNLLSFYNAIKELQPYQKFGCKIYLENTTKVGVNDQGSLDWIVQFITSHPETKDVFGICIDTEHEYSVSGNYPSIETISNIRQFSDVIVHLNTVPKEVTPKSRKDRHSFTTIKECSLNNEGFYDSIITYLNDNRIPWVREVKEETMLREMKDYE